MNASGRKRWLRVVMLVGAVYLIVGVVFAEFANSSASHQMRVTWRLAAWLASAAAFAAQLGYEHFWLRSSPRATALHAAAAVAVGAFALAGAANVHAQWVAAGNRRLLALALVVWPVMTGVPAFVVALAAAAGLARMRRSV